MKRLLDSSLERGSPREVRWGREDSNLRRLSQRVYSPSPLAAREHPLRRAIVAPPGLGEARANRATIPTPALLAQLVEHLHGKEGVDGSSPSEGFKKPLQTSGFNACTVARFGDKGRTGSHTPASLPLPPL